MDKLTELCEFLAWVQDHYTEWLGDWMPVNYTPLTRPVHIDEVVTHYLTERGIKDA